ncbi:TetR/AcrR family transcriptional regulator [Streptosporangium sp. NPDC051022]|uniref:TetR/AcrR family transcriptional regulator n=1 Tax=Streptosporangium sp. NPDC051022 TaxID=3155752 RepID=UPI003415F515
MAGRPRTIDERDIMAAVAAAIGKAGPVRLTLADVARAAGVSTGALVQRYGSKRGLLLGFVRWETAGEAFVRPMRAAFEAAPDPVEGLIRAVVRAAGHEMDPQEFANNLAFLHLELADDEFRALLGDHVRAVRAELLGYLGAAVAGGHLVDTADLGALADAADSIRNGTQLTWAATRSGSLADALRRDLRTLLDPYRPTEEKQ